MSELEEARVLRNSRKEKANETIGILSWLVTGYWELKEDIRKGCHSVTVTEKLLIRALRTARALRPTLHKAKGSLEKYEESIVRVMVLEGLEDWAQYSQGDEHAFESRGISDELDTLGNDVAEILACIDEEQATAEVAGLAARFEEDRDNEEKFNEVYNELAEKAAEAQATFEVAKKYEREAAEAMKATFDKVYRELAREYEADSNRFKDFSTKADDNRYEAGGIRPRNRYKAGGIRPSNRFRARNMRSGNRYMTGGMRSGNGNRYKAGGMRSDNGYRYKAGGMRSDNGHRYRAANMRFGNRYGAGNVRSGSRNRAGSRNKASIRNRTGNRRSSNRKVVGVVDHFKNSVACRNGWTKRNTKPNHDQTRSGRAVQVRGLKGSKRAPKVEIKLRTLDGKEEIGTGMCYPDSAADCSIMGKYTMKGLGIKQQMLGPPDPEGIDAANKSPFTMVGRVKLTLDYFGMTVQDEIHVVKEETDFLVSWDSCIKLGILPENYPNPIKQEPIGARSIKINGENRMNAEDVTLHDEENGTSAGNVTLQTRSRFVQELLSMVQNKEEPSQADLQKVKETLMEEYADVFSVEEQLKPMKCTPMKIELKEDAIPTMCSAPRKIGPAMKPKTKKELDDMERKDVIELVPADRPTEWCHPFCPRLKPTGEVRPTVDLTRLNDWVKRPAHPVTTPHEAVHNTRPGSRFFTKMDAKNGYHQIPLHEDSRDLTTFITPWGRYRFKRAPQGCNATGDKYNYELDVAVAWIEDVAKVVDDIKTATPEIPEHFKQVVQVLEQCRTYGITLSPGKFVFAQPEVTFVGYIIGRDGIKADPEKLKAIMEYPKPTNIHELRSFEGMVNQMGHFSTGISEAQGVLRDLRQKKNVYLWGEAHDRAFEAVKQCLTGLQTLTLFDPELPTRIETDGSKLKGLGYSLQQWHGIGCKCKCSQKVWKSIQCGSRFLSETESRYAPIEFEALGVAWGVDKCRYFLTGLPEFIIRNDHRTLIPILNNKSLNEIDNPRLQRLVEKLRPYTYRAEHVSGKDNCIADALSRAPVDQPTEEDMLGEEASRGIRQIVRRAASCAGIDDELQETLVDPNMEWIKGAAEEDVSYQELLTTLRNGFPDRICETSEVVRPYFGLRDDLSEHNGLVILRSCRIVVPASLRKEILMRLHASHQGMERTQRRARETVYWPGIKSDIINTVASCSMCAERLPSQRKEPLKTDPRPERAFEQTASDLFHWAGNTYIVYVDRYSGWPCVHMWTATPTSRKVINQIKRWFVDWGVPLGVRSDGGPQYDSSEYREFLKAWGVNPPGLSTPTYAQSNGRAEAAVKAMKSLVEKTTVNGDINCDEFQKGLLEWRNTPKEHGKSPAELVFGCQQRSVVPSLQMNMVPKWKANIEKKVAELQRRSERNYNIGARSLERLNIGDKVRVQNAVTQKWDDVGEIMRIGNNRDYVVNIPGKKMGWRNRRFIRFVEESGEDDGPLVRDVEYEWLIETQKNTEVNRLSSVSEDDGHSKPRRSGRERKPVIRFSL